MRHYDTSCGPMSCVQTRKDGVPEFVIKNPSIVVQWCSDTISEITSVVISLMVALHHCTTIYTNFGTPSFLVGTQDIGPHEV